MESKVFVGVDVGSGSARAGIFNISGKLLGDSVHEIKTRKPAPEHFEQSSEDIWSACCQAVRSALAAAGAPEVAGVAFDATCSLVVQGEDGKPLAVGADIPDPTGENANGKLVYDIIMWCDHRATREADHINSSGHKILQHVGGAVSPEMEMPKLAWLKRHRPHTYAAAKNFFDLADYLTCRAADGGNVRSLCTLVCKWNFDAQARSWDMNFLNAIDLADLGVERIGLPGNVRDVGSSVPGGVGARAATDLGLRPGTPLGVGIIDAHAGGLGCLGGDFAHGQCGDLAPALPSLDERLALIAGTSTCHMASSKVPVFVPGVWGPYDSAMIPGLFLNEGGQSAAGAALDYLVQTHAAYPALLAETFSQQDTQVHPTDVLGKHIRALTKSRGLPHAAFLTAGIFVGPDFNGNRSPLADPHLRGSIIGLGPVGPPQEATSIDALSVLYLATMQALAYSTRAIIDAIVSSRGSANCEDAVGTISAVFACGGLARSEFYLREHADALGLPIYLPQEASNAVTLGAAILSATAAGAFPSVSQAMQGMGKIGSVVMPCKDAALCGFHNARYEIFKLMQSHQQQYQDLQRAAVKSISVA